MSQQSKHIVVWEQCLSIISDILPESHFKTWFAPLKPLSLDGSTITLAVPSHFFVEYIEQHFLDMLGAVLKRVIGPSAKLNYSVNVAQSSPAMSISAQNKQKYTNRGFMPDAPSGETNPYTIPGIKRIVVDPQLNPVFTFENFIEGDCNKLGREAGITIAKNPGRNSFNPLFIYGGSGLGKTHLAQAIGIAIKDAFPDKVVLYIPASRFKTQYMNAASVKNKVSDFINFYQKIDVLIIDDVQEFADMPGTQRAFFQIFNHLHLSGKQLILTSDRAPAEMQGLEERLLSRFKWGLAAELLPPAYETRVKILKSKCRQEGVDLDETIVNYLASKITANVRELEGTLFTLIAHATLARREITLELAQSLVEKVVTESKTELTVERIQNVVCNYFGIKPEMILSKTRKREIVQARQIAMYLSRNHTKSSLATIGSQIGGKDHATVLHSCNTVSDLMDTDRTFRQYIVDIERQLTANN